MRILLLQGDEVYWGRVRSYLVGVNADVEVRHSPEDVVGAGRKRPDLLVTGRRFAAHPVVRDGRIPVIVIDDAESEAAGDAAAGRATSELSWPFSKRALLEATAAALHLEPRKQFRALMRVGIAGEKPGTMAESRDFSSAGMSFSSAGYFSPAARLVISLSLPAGDGGLLLQGRVVRTYQEAGGRSTFHGVQFVDLDPGTMGRLMDFILS